MKTRNVVSFFVLMILLFNGKAGFSSGPKSTKVLEIFTNNSGFYFPFGRLLYVTVFSDRRLDYSERGDKEMIVRHRRLTSEQMKRLRILLDAEGVVGASGLIVAENQPSHRDYQTNLEVSIQRAGHIQGFNLRGFEPDAGRPFSRDLGELLCFIDEVRGASYRVSSARN